MSGPLPCHFPAKRRVTRASILSFLASGPPPASSVLGSQSNFQGTEVQGESNAGQSSDPTFKQQPLLSQTLFCVLFEMSQFRVLQPPAGRNIFQHTCMVIFEVISLWTASSWVMYFIDSTKPCVSIGLFRPFMLTIGQGLSLPFGFLFSAYSL